MKNLVKATLLAGSFLYCAAAQAEGTSTDLAATQMASLSTEFSMSLSDEAPLLFDQALPSLEELLPALDIASAEELDEIDGILIVSELESERGGAVVIADQDLTAITAGNTLVGDYIAGSINISDNALSNFTGIGNVLINTGGLTSIQSGINVTINTN